MRAFVPTLPVLLLASAVLLACGHAGPRRPRDARARELDELSALWSFYKYRYVEGGRVVSRDEGGVTTSEGQSYAMLRAVWSRDRDTFDGSWNWTRAHLQVRGDKLFAWKWKDRVLDANSATDADCDIALALVLASRAFSNPRYQEEALAILSDVWAREILRAGGRYYVTAGNWAPRERTPPIHVAYLAPYAYEVFAGVDSRHAWKALIRDAYATLQWIYVEKGLALPPEVIYLDRATGQLLLESPGSRAPPAFGYDSVPLFWRIALDARWFGRGEGELRARMLRFFREEWRRNHRILDRYTASGRPLSALEGLPHLATVHALALIEDPELASELRREKLDALWERALAGESTPYYLQNWIWFDRALELSATRHFDEFLGFLRPFDVDGFSERFPWVGFSLALALFAVARRQRFLKVAFLACGFALSARYLVWRLSTLNFAEPLGPAISIALWLAEAYSLSTVVLLLVQVGLEPARRRPAPPSLDAAEPHPSVDVFIPIYSESLDILDRTLAAATAIRYPRMAIHVCDDSHRPEVERLAHEHGASYIPGPRHHAKAGNLNHALSLTSGDLVAVFDTDHVPVETFLDRTVPWFRDPKMGVVQTPHHFYNLDVFQRTFRAGRGVPNEQDLFNHAIQGARDAWGGAFFVGSGAVFRRRALESVGGFQLLSITEDIHTSQKLHAAGWRSAFVDEDLAAGLSAESLASHLVQRRRWMLGCLQIFFRDNPLLARGLPLRHRVGYFASLWYFFFPLARVVFFATPLWFLLFHLHPLFSDVSVLLAYLVPHLVVVPLMSRAILPGWPRMLWGAAYESAVAFPLFRAMFDLLLPKRLGFKVTPKGILSERRVFDLASSKLTLTAAGLAVLAIGKGLFEFGYFGIEKDAYFFNLAWALANFGALAAALLVAWERPQRRRDERLHRPIPVVISAPGVRLETTAHDVGLCGLSIVLDRAVELPATVEVSLQAGEPVAASARVIYHERVGRHDRCGLELLDLDAASRRALVRALFGRDGAWCGAHDDRARSELGMVVRLARGVAACFAPLRSRQRIRPRRRALRPLTLVGEGRARRVLVCDQTPRGLGILMFGGKSPAAPFPLLAPNREIRWARVIHRRRIGFAIWRMGIEITDEPIARPEVHVYLAA